MMIYENMGLLQNTATDPIFIHMGNKTVVEWLKPLQEASVMVKGVSRQVIVVHAPGEELFDQAIFILKNEAVGKGITDEMLLKQAQKVIRGGGERKKRKLWLYGPVWACGGAVVMGLVWLGTVLL